ncbi:MAG: serine/threonine-protein kinase, partial [Planctomycetota bacterium]
PISPGGSTFNATSRPVSVYVARYTTPIPPGLIGDDKIRARFEREIGILKRLSHPNIVRYYGGGLHEGQRWYAMELIDGGALSQLLKRRGHLNPEQTIEAGRQLCAALEHAHNAGIIHRDLKPGNLFITRRGRIKLGDFGIARDTEASPLTAAGKTVGTYAYMAPEQIRGSTLISRKTDLYAVGCVLYELLTGQTPFLADNPAEMLLAHMENEPFPVREKCPACPPALDQLILRLLEKEPDDRPFDALAVHTELTEIAASLKAPAADVAGESAARAGTTTAAGATGPGTRTTGTESVGKKKKRKRDRGPFYERLWFLVTALTLLVAGTVWYMFFSGPSEETLYQGGYDLVQEVLQNPERDGALTALEEAQDDFLKPALQRFPSGEYAERNAVLLDQARSLTLEIQMEKRLSKGIKSRGDLEQAASDAFRPASDETANPLMSIDRMQAFIERTETELMQPAAGGSGKAAANGATETAADSSSPADHNNPRLWNLLAHRRLSAARDEFLKREDQAERCREYLDQAGEELNGDKAERARGKLSRFVRVFENQPSAKAVCERAAELLSGVGRSELDPG